MYLNIKPTDISVGFTKINYFYKIFQNMKNPTKILLVILLITTSTFCFSQNKKQDNLLPNFKHNIGFQFNPFLNGDLFI